MFSSFLKTVFIFSPGNRAVCKALNGQRHPRGQLWFVKVATEKDRHFLTNRETQGWSHLSSCLLFRISGISDAPMKLPPKLLFIKIRRQIQLPVLCCEFSKSSSLCNTQNKPHWFLPYCGSTYDSKNKRNLHKLC